MPRPRSGGELKGRPEKTARKEFANDCHCNHIIHCISDKPPGDANEFRSHQHGCLNDGDTPWVPFAPYSDQVHIKYFKIDPVQGEVVVLLKAPAGAELPRHHHTGTVIVYTVQGAWKYKEHDWIARAGSVVYETASSRHTPEALRGDEDVIAFNIVKGELVFSTIRNKFSRSRHGGRPWIATSTIASLSGSNRATCQALAIRVLC